ncbi:hypothetical protein [Bacillus glycinifermentans]|uniref:Uncharacterized protein n=1 Tax=Bacillus glycinifermentans TaxID=1664069 RepID=A0A0T6BR94_9BACI|nr:hypothetical protein [Bacillus glycinifermentans]ATH92941.1 hypothetical protein COP00_10310 [Bacillus glycinifermentans]KRT94157.1 hypothetical protein AB447_202385 [Bacillus glycinifermentans]MEC0486360.1 hypothetical protein [Bacillus glycinifermentans]MEC0493332.1 hypothetical protein [Bacillus glycinifermentans]MEC0541501.1 hypothetical protein [Bacillus glycinifermentans]
MDFVFKVFFLILAGMCLVRISSRPDDGRTNRCYGFFDRYDDCPADRSGRQQRLGKRLLP